MKKLLVLLFLVVGFFGVKAIVNSLQEPATGVVVVEPVDLTPSNTITGTTVPTEEEVEEEETEEAEEPMAVEPVVTFSPLDFTGKGLNKFARANGGKVVKIEGAILKAVAVHFDEHVTIAKKGVIVSGVLYVKTSMGAVAINKGEVYLIGGDGIYAPFCPYDDVELWDTYERRYCVGMKCKTFGKFYCPYDRTHIFWVEIA